MKNKKAVEESKKLETNNYKIEMNTTITTYPLSLKL